jgi:RNA polymerase sigma-70 factor (ECF subfamily)
LAAFPSSLDQQARFALPTPDRSDAAERCPATRRILYDDVMSDADAELVRRLRDGEEAAFAELFDAHHATLVRLATAFVKSPSIAEEIAQDTWVAVIDALDSFEGRAAIKTWIARIAINRAKTRAARDGRQVPLEDEEQPSVDPSRFGSFGQFKQAPARWDETPEALVGRQEVHAAIGRCLEDLPTAQRAVVTLRDVEGWTSEEVCNALDVSESNQRVLLHRGRARLRVALEVVLKS